MANNATVKGYKIDFSNNTLIMNYKFSKQAMVYGSREYNIRKSILADYPNMNTIVQSGRKQTKASKTKNLTFKNMEKYITVVDESKVAEFKRVKAARTTANNRYKYVKDWFIENFPNYATNKAFNENTNSENKEPENNEPENNELENNELENKESEQMETEQEPSPTNENAANS